VPSKNKIEPVKKRILIVDDHPMMRQGLAQLINQEPDLCVAWEAGNAAQAMTVVSANTPDIIIADISLPDKNGLELIKDVRVLCATPILVISMHDEKLYAERVLRAGGRGYIMKQEGGKMLMEAVRQVLNGQIYVSGRMSAKILEGLSISRSDASDSPIKQLSDREFEVFRLIGEGKGTRDIARKLHLSVKTVEAHRANIKQKLNLQSSTELVRYAVRWVEAEGAVD